MKKRSVREMLIGGIFFAGFLIGILFVNLWGNTYLKDSGFLGEAALETIRRTEVDARSLFLYVLEARGKCCLLIWLLGYTAAGIPVMLLAIAWLGFLAGALGGLFVIRMGMAGVLLFLAALLPQAVLYAPMVWIGALHIYDCGVSRFCRKAAAGRLWETGRKQGMRTLLLCLALLLGGAILESCCNPWLLKQTVQYFIFS